MALLQGKRVKEELPSRYYDDDLERFNASRQLQHNNALATDGKNQQEQEEGKAPWQNSPTLRAVVRFSTLEEAQRAVRNRNYTYMGNRQVRLRVLP